MLIVGGSPTLIETYPQILSFIGNCISQPKPEGRQRLGTDSVWSLIDTCMLEPPLPPPPPPPMH